MTIHISEFPCFKSYTIFTWKNLKFLSYQNFTPLSKLKPTTHLCTSSLLSDLAASLKKKSTRR